MDKKMNDYLNSMTGGDLDSLSKIISCQYRKFVRFYRLLEDFSDDIESLDYEFNSPLSLDVDIAFDSKKTLKSIKDKLIESMNDLGYDGTVVVKKKIISISIVLEEEKYEDSTD